MVVPSPATSLVLEATSCTRRAPRFSNLSLRTIDLATVTPSEVEGRKPFSQLVRNKRRKRHG